MNQNHLKIELSLYINSDEQRKYLRSLMELPHPVRYQEVDGEVKKVQNPQLIALEGDTLTIRANRYGRIRALLKGGGIHIPPMGAENFQK